MHPTPVGAHQVPPQRDPSGHIAKEHLKNIDLVCDTGREHVRSYRMS